MGQVDSVSLDGLFVQFLGGFTVDEIFVGKVCDRLHIDAPPFLTLLCDDTTYLSTKVGEENCYLFCVRNNDTCLLNGKKKYDKIKAK